MNDDRHRQGMLPVSRRRQRILPGWLWPAACVAMGLVVTWPAPAVAAAQVVVRPRPPRVSAPPSQPSADPPRETPLTDLPAARAWLDRVDRLLAHGDDAAVGVLVAESSPDDVAPAVARARLELRTGGYERALELLLPAAARDPLGDAALEAGLVQQRFGRSEDAQALLAPLVAAGSGEAEGPALARGARAAFALGAHRLANDLFREAVAALGGDPATETAWGELFLATHNESEAARSFERALSVDSAYVPAIVGLAKAAAVTDAPAARRHAARALEIDARAWGAHLVLADLALDARQRAEARSAIGAALAINPRASDALALRAALAAVEDRAADLEADVRAALAINPRDSRPWRVASEHVAGHYRFGEAVALARRAVEVDGEDPTAHAMLGMHLMRTGEEAEARHELEQAFGRDPFDPVTKNLLDLLDRLDTFESVETDGFVFRFQPVEAPILRELAPPLAAQAMASMTARYGVAVQGPVLVELFPRHDDFAVRTLGLPGMVGALGACFGRVVTLDSPRARPPGTFHWGATLWHELAHVIALQLSKQRVPRWFTEGLSVYEERLARPSWGRESELDFVRGLDQGSAIPLASLNEGFSDPRRIALAYQQASLVVEFIAERHGQDAIVRMLRAYGEGLDDAGVFARELKADVTALQAGFDAFLERRYGGLRRALRVPEGVVPEAADSEGARRIADANPGSYPVQMLAARVLLAGGDPGAAATYLERALALAPSVTGAEGPRRLLADIARNQGDAARAGELLAGELAADQTGLDTARELAALAAAGGDGEQLALAHGRIIEVWPYDAASYTVLGRAALASGDAATALRRFRLALAANPGDLVAARTDLAEALLRTGRADAARSELIAALTDAPLYERAQGLLLAIVDGPEGRPRR